MIRLPVGFELRGEECGVMDIDCCDSLLISCMYASVRMRSVYSAT